MAAAFLPALHGTGSSRPLVSHALAAGKGLHANPVYGLSGASQRARLQGYRNALID